ncbi:uncharacterized protein LOC116919718 [Daphnia magna]|uniref:uncharacterized protein LOC116919718 n=1 Tax=Daphnia magna TaxID=35525 RepID=UPI001E1BA8DF|nr:uncharacterized protein LOC116919718 [Daphnia magna]
MAYSLATSSFISALNRFQNRRRVPASYHSDNGTNFVGAERELAECLENLNQHAILRHLGRQPSKWVFNPPAAPHFGGSGERMVRAAKIALRSVLGKQRLTDEILLTALTLIENILNSRKLIPVSEDPNDPECLTPNHLLLGRATPNLPPDVFTEDDLSAKERWRIAQAVTEQFWRRWMKEILPSLTEREKWLWAQLHARYSFVKYILNVATENKNVSRDTTHIPKFDGSNFHTWKFGLMLLLRNNELQQIVLDEEKLPAEIKNTENVVTSNTDIKLWLQRDTLPSNYIYATVTDRMREYLIYCETSAAMWTRLSTRFTLRTIANKGQLWSQFYEYQFNQSQDMLANITSVESLVRQLKDLEETVTEAQTTNKVVSILPSQFQHFRVVWDTYKEYEQTMELLTFRLLAEERRMETAKRETPDISKPAEAFTVTHHYRRGNYRGGRHSSNNRW